MEKTDTLKEQLYTHCLSYTEMKINSLKKEIDGLQDSANNETKSSAGDKYETGREMVQQQINLHLAQMNEFDKAKQILSRINAEMPCTKAAPGALIITSQGNYYIAINAGKVTIDGILYQTISAASPIGAALLGKETNAQFLFNGKQFIIEGVL